MKITGIEHLGIAVENLDTAAPFWQHLLRTQPRDETVVGQGVKTRIYDTGQGKVELLEALDPDSPIAQFLTKKGPGIHHVCLEVSDITEAIKELKESNIELIGSEPDRGVEGYSVIFIHPRSTGGVLVELAQKVPLDE
ncbi:MAG: methylmalonyl-CoA epimerase [Fidelibacterota bacterium]